MVLKKELIKKIKELNLNITKLKSKVKDVERKILYEKANLINTQKMNDIRKENEIKNTVIYFLNMFLELYSFKIISKSKILKEYLNEIFSKIEFRYDLKKIEPKIGEIYNPKIHRCISSKNKKQNKKIKNILRIGYKFSKSKIASIYALITL